MGAWLRGLKMLSAEPPFLGWAVLTCNNRRWGSRTSGEWASLPFALHCRAVLTFGWKLYKKAWRSEGFISIYVISRNNDSRPNQKHRKRKPHPQQHPPQRQQQRSQHFARCACQTSMLQATKRLRTKFRTKLVQRFLSSAALPSGDFAGLRRRACQTSMLQIPKRLSRAFYA